MQTLRENERSTSMKMQKMGCRLFALVSGIATVVVVLILEPWLLEDGFGGGLICPSSVINSVSGVLNCAVIQGDLIIGEDAERHVDVRKYFPNVQNITGSLRAQQANDLVSVTFEAGNSPVWIGGSIQFDDNLALESVVLEAVECVNSYVEITGDPALTNISLPSLQRVESYLEISGNEKLDSITLTALESVNGYVDFSDNGELPDIDLPLLQMVGSYFEISRVGKIKSIDLPALGRVNGFIEISEHPELLSIFLPVLQSVQEYVRINDNSVVESIVLPALESITGCDNSPGFLEIESNPMLTSVDLSALCFVDLYVRINDNLSLESFDLPVLESISGSTDVPGFIEFSGNEVATHFRAPILEYTTDEGGLGAIFQTNPMLKSIDLGRVAVIECDFSIHPELNEVMPYEIFFGCVPCENIGIIDPYFFNGICGIVEDDVVISQAFVGGIDLSLCLPHVEKVSGSVLIEGANSLTTVNWNLLSVITGNFVADNNAELTTISLPAVTNIDGNCRFYLNAALQHINVPLLSSVYDFIAFTWNEELREIRLPALCFVGDYFTVSGHAKLQEIILPALSNVGFTIDVINNIQIQEISLPALRSVGSYFRVHGNEELQSISIPIVKDIAGAFLIFDNLHLKYFRVPTLAFVGEYLLVRDNPQLEDISFPNVTFVGDPNGFSTRFQVSRNAALQLISLPKLLSVGDYILVNTNEKLQSIRMPSLQEIGSYCIFDDNTELVDICPDWLNEFCTTTDTTSVDSVPWSSNNTIA